jgi:diaminopimelate decarboxylase
MRSRCCRISCATLRADGHTIEHVDLGGGLGIPYREDDEPPPDPAAYAEVVKRATRGLGCKLIFEPGRLIVGNAGILVTRVIYVKRGEAKTFVIVDAAMNDLIRPTLYEAHHDIMPVRPVPGDRGSVPTWSDRSARPAITSRSTATCRNPRPGPARGDDRREPMARCRRDLQHPALVPEVLVNGDAWSLVRPRLEADALIALDRMPPWL